VKGGATQDGLAQRWAAEWPSALAAWSSYTQLSSPTFLEKVAEARREHMQGEIAAIRLQDQKVMVNAKTIRQLGLEEHALAIMAHEIGHHVYVPGNLTDNARMLAAMGRMLVGLPSQAVHLCANLYGDLLINDRLQRRAGVDIAAVYRALAARQQGTPTETWKVYARTYEHLWRLPAGSLVSAPSREELDADALLLSRIVRSFAGDWLKGARRFAAVMYRYLAEDEQAKRQQTFAELGLHDTRGAGAPPPGQGAADAIPDGLASVDPSELEDADDFDGDVLDPLGEGKDEIPKPANTAPDREGKGKPGEQFRRPFEYGQLLKALGLNLEEHEVTTRYYRERALPHLLPFPSRRAPQVVEPLAEGYREWEASEPLDDLDVLGSLTRSPVLVPGVTTVQRVYGESPGTDPARTPVDLDIYVDCSGSMPNPAMDVSYLALAGTILTLSALRAGARVQATLWSGPGQFETTHGFVRDERRVLGVVTGYIAGSTAFPLHALRETYTARKPTDPAAHVVVISDDGVTTMLQRDEEGTPGAAVCTAALERARGGGTLVLNIPGRSWPGQSALEELGFRVHRVTQWDELVAFARAFVRETYGDAP
jgi:hypothetical protein